MLPDPNKASIGGFISALIAIHTFDAGGFILNGASKIDYGP